MEMALCYEVHGLQGRYFNLISEPGLSVNAHYMLQDPDKPLHFIDEVTVVATNKDGQHIEMRVNRDCNLVVDGSTTEFLNHSGVLAEATPAYSDVIIIAHVGQDGETALAVNCSAPHEHGFMQLDISRNLTLVNYSSHGLLGKPMVLVCNTKACTNALTHKCS